MQSERPFRGELPEALELWQREGLVSSSQVRRILAYHGLASQPLEEARRTGRLATIVGVLGALLVGIGIILFVASNWQQMDRLQRIALLLAALLLAYGAGYLLRYEPGGSPRVGEALIFLGSVVFGANVFLIAQIYHVAAGEPLLLALWSAGAFAVAYAMGLRPPLYLAILAAVGWYGFQLAAWRIDSAGAAVVGLAAFVPYGLLLLSLGELQRSFRSTERFSAAFVQLGLLVALIPLWVFSFGDFWRTLSSDQASPIAGGSTEANLAQLHLSFALFAVLALLLTLWAVRRLGPARSAMAVGAGIALLGASSLVALFHPFQDPRVYAIVFNGVILAGVLWAVVVGLWTRRESFINLGLAFFVLLVFGRYFDFLFSFMDRSLAFILAGVLLLGGGYLLERSRRRLLERIHPGEEPGHAA